MIILKTHEYRVITSIETFSRNNQVESIQESLSPELSLLFKLLSNQNLKDLNHENINWDKLNDISYSLGLRPTLAKLEQTNRFTKNLIVKTHEQSRLYVFELFESHRASRVK